MYRIIVEAAPGFEPIPSGEFAIANLSDYPAERVMTSKLLNDLQSLTSSCLECCMVNVAPEKIKIVSVRLEEGSRNVPELSIRVEAPYTEWFLGQKNKFTELFANDIWNWFTRTQSHRASTLHYEASLVLVQGSSVEVRPSSQASNNRTQTASE